MTARRRGQRGLPVESEAQWQQKIVQLAGFYQWRVYHTHDSRRSNPGFPDLVLLRGPELIFAELKGPKTRVTAEQEDWLAALRVVADGVRLYGELAAETIADGTYDDTLKAGEAIAIDVYLWRAPDIDPVHKRLARGCHRLEPVP